MEITAICRQYLLCDKILKIRRLSSLLSSPDNVLISFFSTLLSEIRGEFLVICNVLVRDGRSLRRQRHQNVLVRDYGFLQFRSRDFHPRHGDGAGRAGRTRLQQIVHDHVGIIAGSSPHFAKVRRSLDLV